MTDLAHVVRLAAADHHLAVFTVARPDGTVHASGVSAGVIADPVDGSAGVGAVLNGGTRKLALLRHNPRATLVFKDCLLYTSPSPRDRTRSRMPSSA